MVGSLKRITANVGGPVTTKRRILAYVVDPIILYAALVWREALEVESKAII